MFASDGTLSTNVAMHHCHAVEAYGKDVVVAAGYAMMGSMYAIIHSPTSHLRTHIAPFLT